MAYPTATANATTTTTTSSQSTMLVMFTTTKRPLRKHIELPYPMMTTTMMLSLSLSGAC